MSDSTRPALTAEAFGAALCDAGVIESLHNLTQVVIDARAGSPVTVYTTRIADDRLVDVAALLTSARTEQVTGARYWVARADKPDDEEWWPECVCPLGATRRLNNATRLHLVEDLQAPYELNGYQVELVLDEGPDGSTVIQDRVVVDY